MEQRNPSFFKKTSVLKGILSLPFNFGHHSEPKLPVQHKRMHLIFRFLEFI
jgi:hypothetical protein